MSILRPYQRQAIDAFWETLTPTVNRVAIEMATGLGKTVTGSFLAGEWLDNLRGVGERVLILVHTEEITGQWEAKLAIGARGFSVGVVKAGRNEPDADVVVASVQTLANSARREQIRDVGLIIVDECHHAVAGTYRAVLDWFGAYGFDDPSPISFRLEPGTVRVVNVLARPIPVLGLTATLARSDGQGLGQVWQDLAFSRSLSWAIRKGYLIDLVPYTIKIPDLDTSGTAADLDAELADSIAPEAVVAAWLDKTLTVRMSDLDDVHKSIHHERPSTVLFAPLVKSAQAFADAFNTAGVKAEVVHGEMSDASVAAVLDRYNAGTTTVVCNAMKLTEGWDSPRTMCVIVARPTKSVPLFVQMVGRGLRPWLDMSAPAREEQRCVLLCVQGGTTDLATVADLSERIGDVQDGQSLLSMEDEWDIGKEIEPTPVGYAGPVRVEQWDMAVQASTKAWKYTDAGAPYLPTAKRQAGYVFLTEQSHGWSIWAYESTRPSTAIAPRRRGALRIGRAPDLELAMAMAEDEAQERGGDIGALLADKGRAWRKGKPTEAALAEARRVLDPKDIDRIMSSRASGKAGKLSDLIDRVKATRALDGIVRKIKERG